MPVIKFILCISFIVLGSSSFASQAISVEKNSQKEVLNEDNEQNTENSQEEVIGSSELLFLEEEESSLAAQDLSKGLEAFWKTEFKVNFFTDRSTTNTVLSTEIYGKINWSFVDYFSFHTQGLIIGRSGFTQSIFDRSDRKNGLYLLEGYFKIKPSPYFSIRMGSAKQDFLEAPLFITDKTFPSLIQTFAIPFSRDSKLSLIFQQAIPDNAVESVRRETQLISTPFFFTSSAFLEFNSLTSQNIALKTSLTAFHFQKLSPAVAILSQIRGNTTERLSGDSKFKYKYSGVYANAHLQIPLSHQWIFEMGGDFLHNFQAPDAFNQGERVYTSFYRNYRDFIELKMTAEYFANQSDASVSYYNSEVYGHNNRVGGLLKWQSHFYNSGITLGVTYVYSEPINAERSSVGVSNSISVFLGTNYVSI